MGIPEGSLINQSAWPSQKDKKEGKCRFFGSTEWGAKIILRIGAIVQRTPKRLNAKEPPKGNHQKKVCRVIDGNRVRSEIPGLTLTLFLP